MRDRAVSPAVGYALTVAITAILVVGLFSASASLVETQRGDAVESELRVVGNRLAGDLATADALVRSAGSPSAATVTAALPERTAGGSYTVSLTNQTGPGDGFRYRLALESPSAEVSVAVTVKTGTPVAETTLSGGRLVVAYDPSTGRLEVTG